MATSGTRGRRQAGGDCGAAHGRQVPSYGGNGWAAHVRAAGAETGEVGAGRWGPGTVPGGGVKTV
jgi:hypothetical protein